MAIPGPTLPSALFYADFSATVSVQSAYATDVGVAQNTDEKRLGLVQKPYRTQTFRNQAVEANQAALLNELVRASQKQTLKVPLYSDRAFLSAAVVGGNTVLPIDSTTGKRFFAGKELILAKPSTRKGEYTVSVYPIASVATNSITLSSPLGEAWVKGTRVFPAMVADVSLSGQWTAETDTVHFAELAFVEVVGDSALPPLQIIGSNPAGFAVFKGKPVFDLDVAWQNVQPGYVRPGVRSKVGLGNVTTLFGDRSMFTLQRDFRLPHRADFNKFMRFWDSRAGRLHSFWIADESAPLPVVAATSTTLDFSKTFVTLEKISRVKHLRLSKMDGTKQYVKVTNIADTGGVYRLDLEDTITGTLSAVHWLFMCRFQADSIEEKWLTDEFCDVVVSVIELMIEGDDERIGDLPTVPSPVDPTADPLPPWTPGTGCQATAAASFKMYEVSCVTAEKHRAIPRAADLTLPTKLKLRFIPHFHQDTAHPWTTPLSQAFWDNLHQPQHELVYQGALGGAQKSRHWKHARIHGGTGSRSWANAGSGGLGAGTDVDRHYWKKDIPYTSAESQQVWSDNARELRSQGVTNNNGSFKISVAGVGTTVAINEASAPSVFQAAVATLFPGKTVTAYSNPATRSGTTPLSGRATDNQNIYIRVVNGSTDVTDDYAWSIVWVSGYTGTTYSINKRPYGLHAGDTTLPQVTSILSIRFVAETPTSGSVAGNHGSWGTLYHIYVFTTEVNPTYVDDATYAPWGLTFNYNDPVVWVPGEAGSGVRGGRYCHPQMAICAAIPTTIESACGTEWASPLEADAFCDAAAPTAPWKGAPTDAAIKNAYFGLDDGSNAKCAVVTLGGHTPTSDLYDWVTIENGHPTGYGLTALRCNNPGWSPTSQSLNVLGGTSIDIVPCFPDQTDVDTCDGHPSEPFEDVGGTLECFKPPDEAPEDCCFSLTEPLQLVLRQRCGATTTGEGESADGWPEATHFLYPWEADYNEGGDPADRYIIWKKPIFDPTVVQDNFADDFDVIDSMAGWDQEVGTWTEGAGRARVVDPASSGAVRALATVSGKDYGDLTIRVEVKTDNECGIFFRVSGTPNSTGFRAYYAAMDIPNNRVRLYKIVDSTVTQLAEATASPPLSWTNAAGPVLMVVANKGRLAVIPEFHTGSSGISIQDQDACNDMATGRFGMGSLIAGGSGGIGRPKFDNFRISATVTSILYITVRFDATGWHLDVPEKCMPGYSATGLCVDDPPGGDGTTRIPLPPSIDADQSEGSYNTEMSDPHTRNNPFPPGEGPFPDFICAEATVPYCKAATGDERACSGFTVWAASRSA